MSDMASKLRNGVAFGTLASTIVLANSPAIAAGQSDAATLYALQARVQTLGSQVQELERNQDAATAHGGGARDPGIRLSLKNGRPTFSTADGNFSFALRSLVQFDTAYYNQGRAPAGSDLSSGSNFRRARLGFDGTAFKDWSYEFIYDFGGSGTESGQIYSAYIQYNGLGPLHLRLGASPVPESFEDTTAASDLLFLERAQPADVARSIAGGPGRDNLTAFLYGDNYFGSLAYTGGKAGDAAVFDEQQAAVGRIAYAPIRTKDATLALGFNGTYVFKLPDVTAGANSPNVIRFKERPELNVDGTSLIDTGNIDAKSVSQWGVEAAGNWRNFYGQGGYFGLDAQQRIAGLPNASFDGWYAQASWVLTGEEHQYNPSRGAFDAPKVRDPWSPDRPGLGAWEIAARYSDLDLNDNAGVLGAATPAGGIRGGEQKIWTAGLNWYPNNVIRFLLDYQHADVTRLGGAGAAIGQKIDAVSLRAQLSL
jgi:phosphate-selective porin OprO/OprP